MYVYFLFILFISLEAEVVTNRRLVFTRDKLCHYDVSIPRYHPFNDDIYIYIYRRSWYLNCNLCISGNENFKAFLKVSF